MKNSTAFFIGWTVSALLCTVLIYIFDPHPNNLQLCAKNNNVYECEIVYQPKVD